MNEQIETSRKKPGARGMGKNSLNLIKAMVEIVAAAQPITGRGVGYKLFVKKLIPSMKTNDMQRVYRLLKEAREQGIIPWDWIVDESRQLEKTASWNDPDEYTRTMINAYRASIGTTAGASKSGLRRARCAACFVRSSTNTASASASCMVSPALPSSMTLPRTTMAAS